MSENILDPMQFPRYEGIRTFMRMPYTQDLEGVDFAIVGLPYDTCASFRVGSRFGPSAIRDISPLNKRYNPVLDVDIFEHCKGIDYGDLMTVPGYVEDSFDEITRGMSTLFEAGVVPIAMGGDHSVTLPELRACKQTHGPVALVHFDSHCDTWKEYYGKPYNHGTPFYYAAKEGCIDGSHSIQVGIRGGLYSKEGTQTSKDLGMTVLPAVTCHKMTTEEIIAKIKETVGDRKVFLTFDVDFLDPAFAPGTGTPEIGGFSTATALEIIRGLKDLDIVGYDVVEVAPQYDHGEITAFAAAHLMFEFMTQIAYRKSR